MTEETSTSDSAVLSEHEVVRQAALALLAECEAAGHPPVTDEEVAEFRHRVGWDAR